MTTQSKSLAYLEQTQDFIRRHIGPNAEQTQAMLKDIGAESVDALINEIVPSDIRLSALPAIEESKTEAQALSDLKAVASLNKVNDTYIGLGYYGTLTPNVILRNVLENPGWYTAYTPYQPEIAQGRLESLLNYQQMCIDLTGLELASASLLDEGTAAAEAMALAKRVSKNKKSNLFFISSDVYPQTIDVVKQRAEMFDFDVIVAPAHEAADHDVFGALLQYPSASGEITDISELIEKIHANKGIVAVAADIMSLVMLKAPGELGADAVIGSSQRFGVPMGYGGPHAAFFTTSEKYKRSLPGRIIGVSKDTRGNAALRMAMQTREQHIRREKANSNICTAQVLLANMAAFYAVYHGPKGLKIIANRIHRFADILCLGTATKGLTAIHANYFDTLTFNLDNKEEIVARALAAGVNFRTDVAGQISISLDETTTRTDIAGLFDILLGAGHGLDVSDLDDKIVSSGHSSIPAALVRESEILTHPVFNSYHSETEMLRYIKRLENKDLALNHSMISLGSCTMKLNATAQMIPVSWPEFANMHPFAPIDQAQGYKQMIDELGDWLVELTGYDNISMQPNSGAQGEYAGLIAIVKYHESRGDAHRNICLIPSSAHGTNPASAQMVGMKVVVVACDKEGNVDMNDLRTKASEMADNLACIMITYPSTHGVYETTVAEICNIVHEHGGQVYLDGANMNAQVGVTSPGYIGADVSHLNLHKTFAIPHGGGGPGMGPIGVKAHLAPFLPDHALINIDESTKGNGAVAAAPFGSAGILCISYLYCAMLGKQGVTDATKYAITNANYLAKKLSQHYPLLYAGKNGRVAHECIIDLRPLKATSGISEVDIAKRLIDYGFHAPTMSFPVAGTFMIEPTESESKVELDRFVEAMVSIRDEVRKVESGEWSSDDNPLHNAPHTLADITDTWERGYSIKEAVFPVPAAAKNKFWPTVNRIDDVYGDRNLICSCPPIESYQD
ncbi:MULTISPECIES: aminomethyl-transferring glycine dehydrogenase [unclassified Colwellia]|uniref:aminomethyl-transferring glycine dehydrogenase n=1 Tax=unclassified Colwellia TaxID=196834 RepID=UPI0015F5D294|nr:MULTISPECIES: aminomethyl-transferring glycine dehydrogenase [unclassified Colwellia]MBA6351256.1 aminomethyl-transferring glycine dehydrogenase [Colwellia sp. BRX9-1]MBA6354797.1 aminomethyl-transferring glycine dehydrogenase [Colwellia sp. BRX8-3]MBA6360081.1 aminomethyl-transferring glycine dehydrogenase [Colwellia sp. BRX8-6]MBA6368233.1 aminomethyl-transferring glycine dehydrogenase [Colwellia sp. BRX8-5]MBA6377310.1 aminomethyl-transferring glycine dehydrogenase [Colwellia sp. BRX8-2]